MTDAALPVPQIRTARVLLRGWREADREPFAVLNGDPEVTAFLSTALTREQSDAFVDRIEGRWRHDGYGLWAVERVDDGAFLGFTGLAVPVWAPEPTVELGWRFARHAWGHGYATEAARAAAAFAFESLRLGALVSYVAELNVRSRAVAERLGMVRDATADFGYPRFPEGHPLRPHVTYRLSRGECAAASGQSQR